MFHFAEAEYFHWLWVLPLLVAWYIFGERRSRRRLDSVFGEENRARLAPSFSPKRRGFRFACQVLALGFFLVALARPQMGKTPQVAKSRGIELMIALDVSNSMLAEDVRPSRLEQAKRELGGLLDQLGGDQVGLVAFAGSALLVSPLTGDKSALKMLLESLGPGSIGSQGTDFSRALQEAAGAFQRGGVDREGGVSRVILVASDGEGHEPGALDLAEDLARKGIRVFSLAFGTERGGRIPLKDSRGFLKGYKRDEKGRDVVTRLLGDSLKELASRGRGSFHHIIYGGGQMERLRQELDQLEKAEFDSTVASHYDEKYQIFLLIAWLLALGGLFLGDRRPGGSFLKTSRFFSIFFSFFLGASPLGLSLLGPSPAGARSLSSIWENNRAVEDFQKEAYSSARRKFLNSLLEAPFDGQVQFNLGVSLEALGQPEKALKQYDALLGRNPGLSLAFSALFNKARLLGEKKDVDGALATYQGALALQPHSKEVKTNIELLLRGGEGGDPSSEGEGDSQGWGPGGGAGLPSKSGGLGGSLPGGQGSGGPEN